MVYRGSCHCGKVTFEATGEITNVMECNCSICTKKGYLLWMIPRAQLKLLTPPENMASYKFNKKAIDHYFCPNCGCGPFGEGTEPKSGTMMAAINVRCLEGVNLTQLKRMPFDGRSL